MKSIIASLLRVVLRMGEKGYDETNKADVMH
jgi:hypothetical protein